MFSSSVVVDLDRASDGGESYLVGAPDPGGQYGEAEQQPRPGKVPRHWVSEQVEGISARQVASGVGHCH